MRVTTAMLYQAGTQGILDRQADLFRTQMQLSSGRRILSPADDPIASSQAVSVSQAKDQNAQFTANVTAARNALTATEGAVSDLQDAIAGTRDLLLAGANGTLGDADRQSIAKDLRARLSEMLEIANRKDGNGRALFGGFMEDGVPFVDNGAAVAYTGDQGTRSLAISASRSLPVGVSGAALFEGVPTGNGTFRTAAAAGNAGSAWIDVGSVTNLPSLTGHDYQMVFSVAGGNTTYDIVDTTLGVTISSGNPYTSGAAISFDGMQAKVSGAPANGDTFTVAPAPRQDLFATVKQAITLLESPASTPAAGAQFQTGIQRALASLDQGTERALGVRTQVGAGLRELDAMDTTLSGLALGYDQQLSQLRDLDFAQAVSDFTREQQALQAAQKAFQGATQLSLFSLL